MLANLAAMRAQSRVLTTQQIRQNTSGIPPMAKWLAEPVNAVKAMIKTLVPTAVFSSYPSTEVRSSSIIMPPPAPIKPQMNPTPAPQSRDCTNRFSALTAFIELLVVMTGRTMNFTPSRRVIKVEKPPIVRPGTRLAT